MPMPHLVLLLAMTVAARRRFRCFAFCTLVHCGQSRLTLALIGSPVGPGRGTARGIARLWLLLLAPHARLRRKTPIKTPSPRLDWEFSVTIQ